VAAGFAVIIAAIFAGSLVMQFLMDATYLPESTRQQRSANMDRLATYSWIRAGVPAEASFFTGEDALLYLYTGHHAMSNPLPPPLWYREDHAGMVHWLTDIVPFSRAHGLTYFVFTGVDARQGMSNDDPDAVETSIRLNPDLALVHQQGTVTVYKFR